MSGVGRVCVFLVTYRTVLASVQHLRIDQFMVFEQKY